jgi:predicted nucleic acid-binding protein
LEAGEAIEHVQVALTGRVLTYLRHEPTSRSICLDEPLLDRAGDLGPAELRSSDAIHLARALSIGPELGLFVTYDGRLGEALFLKEWMLSCRVDHRIGQLPMTSRARDTSRERVRP